MWKIIDGDYHEDDEDHADDDYHDDKFLRWWSNDLAGCPDERVKGPGPQTQREPVGNNYWASADNDWSY